MTFYDPAVNDLVFQQTKGQRRYDVAMLIICAAFAVAGLVVALSSHDWKVRAISLAGACLILVPVVAVPLERGRTIVTSQGIQSVRRFRRRSWSWSEITGIDVKVVQERNTSRWVRITTSSGKSIRLPAPYDFSVVGDPDFDERMGVIRDRWARVTGRNPEPERARDTGG